MTKLLMLVEGQSEEIFVKQTLTPFLAERKVYVQTIVLWTNRDRAGGGFRGGVSNWNQILKNLKPLTRDTDAWITTLMDFYGLPEDFPGYQDSCNTSQPHRAVVALQERFSNEIKHSRFIPFLALHEFEAWLFCCPEVVAEHYGIPELAASVRDAVEERGEPELINHGRKTHPKARLRGMVGSYKETSDGPTMMKKIGIPSIRKACPHFASWLCRLEKLGQEA